MIFAAATDEKSLFVFPSPEEAIAYCEGIDVGEGGWLFWDDRGAPLQALFATSNYRGRLGVIGSGTYQLVPAQFLPTLREALGGLHVLEDNPLFQSFAAVQAHLAAAASVPQDASNNSFKPNPLRGSTVSGVSPTMLIQDLPLRCPCCGYKTLSDRGGFEICAVCFWEDDGQDDDDADEVLGGPNGDLSLTQARSNYQQFGASRKQDLPHVRPPRPEES